MELEEILWLTAEDVRGFSAAVFFPAKSPGEYPERPIDGPVGNVPNLFTYGERELDIALIAATYGHDIARAHSFRDGNKRTALMSMVVFLELHGYELDLPNDETLVPIMLEVAEGSIDAFALYRAIIDFVKPLNDAGTLL